ncbi:unnamed protein product [Chondrus crispus]|uniref:Uncharacterized protein n=1 Tax=Chondrus crispus TaxID=2769 RepID=R7QFH8_CHOCR|nr:unnamed protein product [Chondrus crispus]CDF36206.1 unnamed protein product [Chondrus crispus]|eukprot:XP_005716025.1 unnamed protein product [Chondrus crispus]
MSGDLTARARNHLLGLLRVPRLNGHSVYTLTSAPPLQSYSVRTLLRLPCTRRRLPLRAPSSRHRTTSWPLSAPPPRIAARPSSRSAAPRPAPRRTSACSRASDNPVPTPRIMSSASLTTSSKPPTTSLP